jgi:uncharacterized protein YbaA (DUF1428 family)
MANYVDGFVLPVPKKNLNIYRRMAQQAGRIWRGHGALEFRECVGDDLNVKWDCRFRAGSRQSPARPWCFRGLLTSPVHIATA